MVLLIFTRVETIWLILGGGTISVVSALLHISVSTGA
jgi:hypothetical protein